MLDEPYKRLVAVRERAGFATASDAARYHGWNENTYRSHENGERGIRPLTAAKYALAFKASAAYILVGEQADNFSNFSKLILNGSIDESALVRTERYAANYETGSEIFSVVMFREHYYAFEVIHDDLFGFLSNGDLVVAARFASNIDQTIGRLCFIKIDERNGHFSYVKKGSIDGTVNIENSPRKPERLVTPLAIHPMVAIICRGNWSKVPMALYKLPRDEEL